MMRIEQTLKSIAVAALIMAACASPVRARSVLPDEAKSIAEDAYVYGYSLVSVEMTRKVVTNVETPTTTRAPMGQFAVLRKYPSAAFRDVTAPNADTLYASAFVDVSREPWIVSWPDMGSRYYVFTFYSAWVPVLADPGSRTTGQKAQTYAITGPGWHGKLPAGVKQVSSPTAIAWVLARVYSSGTRADYQSVWALQDQFRIYPLSAYGKPYVAPPGKVDPGVDMKRSVRDSVNALDATEYFSWLAKLMESNPPAPKDAPIVARMAKIGIVPGQRFDIDRFGPAVAAAIAQAPKTGWTKIAGHTRDVGQIKNGWLYSLKIGHYGTDYLTRAWLSAFGIPANEPKDATYLVGMVDADRQPLDAEHNNYVVHFKSRNDLPPANGFWSLTMYDKGYFFVPNALDRYTLSQRNQLKVNADGSIDLYLQKDNPGPDKEANWLPTPAAGFIPMLRMFWPKEGPPSILDGSWSPPVIRKN
jgi:hypothetical protein